MKNSNQYIRIGIALFPVLIFGLSLTQDGFSYQYAKVVVTLRSTSLLLMGELAFLGGGILESLVWLANPLALFAGIRFWMESSTVVKIEPVLKTVIPRFKPSSYWLSALAALMAWSFLPWNEVLANEAGTIGKILNLEAGYWLWVTSLTLLALGINCYHFFIGFNKTDGL